MQVSSGSKPLPTHPDRLLPAEAGRRRIARDLYDQVAGMPIISPHGHVPVEMLAENAPFNSPAELFITPDHYITRLLHAHGVPLAELGVGAEPLGDDAARRSWRILCEMWAVFAGTPIKYWLEDVLVNVFDVEESPSGSNAQRLYDQISERLLDPAFLPRALVERFNIETLATTDDPMASLEQHRTLRDMEGFRTEVIPTIRIERCIDPARSDWNANVDRLVPASGGTSGGEDTFEAYLEAIADRRHHFVRHGAVSLDCALVDAQTAVLSVERLAGLYRKARNEGLSTSEATLFRAAMVSELVRQSRDDGLVVTLHVGSLRDYDRALYERYGADRGCDIPLATPFTEGLRPLLNEFGHDPGLHLVLFTLDETSWGRELAPLAGFYPSVHVGAPWWFFDEPEAILRYRSAVTAIVGFGKQSGFIDDTRALCSIPSRHDMARRLDCAFLSKLVSEHRLSMEEASNAIRELSYELPRSAFKLDRPSDVRSSRTPHRFTHLGDSSPMEVGK